MASQARLIDTIPEAERQKAMEVLVLGMSRTGTMSLKAALQKLGYSVYHMSEACMRWEDKHLQLWREALDAKYNSSGLKPYSGANLEKILQNYTAIEDIPCIMFVEELLEQYPNAKVILTNRDVEAWIPSFRNTFLKVLGWRTLPWVASIDPIFWAPYYSLLTTVVHQWTGGDITSDAALRESFDSHYANVRSLVPKEKLLEYQVKEGWEPLCEFLGNDVPSEEFPRVNDAKQAVRIHHFIYWYRLWRISQRYVIGGTVMLVAVGVGYWRLGR